MKKIKLILKATIFCLAAALTMGVVQAGTGTTNLLNNWSFELPGTVKISTGFDTIPFWFSDATATDSGVENGEVPPDGSIWNAYLKGSDTFARANQTTTHIIRPGECFIASIWCKNEWVYTSNYTHTNGYLTVVLYYGGTPDTVVGSANTSLGTVGTPFFTNTFVILPGSASHTTESDWTNYMFGVITDAVPAVAIGQPIGIQFWNSSTQYNASCDGTKTWMEEDDVQLYATNGISPIATPVVLTPTNSVWGGDTLTFTESGAFGSLPMTYQWQTDGGSGGAFTNIPGATLTNLAVVTSTNAGTYSYQVVITNVYGSCTTAVSSYLVRGLLPPVITQDTGTADWGTITNILAFIGGNVNFYASVNGAPVVTNQWDVNTGSGYVPIAGATNFLRVLTNVQPSSVGFYKLGATNAIGWTNTTPAHLAALADPATPSGVGMTNMYSYCVMTNHPWAYWKFEETNDTFLQSMQAYDYSGHNFDATYGNSDPGDLVQASGCFDGGESLANLQSGPNAAGGYPGFPNGNMCAGLQYDADNGNLTIPPLNLNTNTVTFTMWIYPNQPHTIAVNSGLLYNRNGADGAGVGFSSNANTNGVASLGYTWNQNSATTYGWDSKLYPPGQQWSFVAYVISPSNTTIYLYYVNSKTNLLKAVQSGVTNNPEAFSGGTSWIGGDNWTSSRTFDGYIDEVAVFTNVLSESQIQGLFLTSIGLTNGLAPVFTTQPANTQVYRGQLLQIPALAGGIPSPNYQWQFENGATWYNAANSITTGIYGATNATFGWTNYGTGTIFTNFRCIAYNGFGTNISTAVSVSVLPVPTNGQWTVNFAVTSTNNGGTGLPYVGHGVLLGPGGVVPGTYWNALSGAQLTSTSSYRDNGSTVSGIRFGATYFPGNFSSLGGGVTNNALLDTFAQITPTNTFMFSNVPNGRYNLALYGCVGSYANRGITFTVLTNGVSAGTQSVTNVQDIALLPDNTVIYTNLLVVNGGLEVDMAAVPSTPLNPTNSTEGDFNGAQLQLVKYGPDILSLTNSGANFILTYAGGQLLQSTNMSGPWTTNLTAVSPFTIYPTGQMKFYRIYSSSNY